MTPEEVIPIAQLFADAMNQLAFISAIVGGFAVALLAGVLGKEKRALTRWTVGVLSASALLQISCTLFFSLSSFRILTYTANNRMDDLNAFISGIDPQIGPFVIAFFLSFLLFFAGIALTGWFFGKRTGWAGTIISVLATCLAFYGLAIAS
ncbi:MAG: hypothetical protein HKN29_11175 [Rhodothermales bacterium]|nr:hypothetical protein [Rhodothermales bacterium]